MICPECGNENIKTIEYNHQSKTSKVLCKTCNHTWIQVKI